MAWRVAVRRTTGDTNTRRSRRTLALPGRCIDALRAQRVQQAADRLAAGPLWKESGLVFTTAVGTQMDPANVCRDLRRALKLVPGREPEDRKTSRFLEREVPQPQPTMSPWWPLMADGE